MRGHLDPPFNERFSKFIQIVRMKGVDYVRLSANDLRRLCDGEGDHLADLQILQSALHRPNKKPKSPHVRDIFSLPPSCSVGAPDIFGAYTAELTFDWVDEDLVEPVFECIIPLPSTPTLSLRVELPPIEQITPPSPPSDDEDSLIDMYSPVALSVDHYSDSNSTTPDIFDEEHLSSLCSSPTSFDSGRGDEIDIIGLYVSDGAKPIKKQGQSIPDPAQPKDAHLEMETGVEVGLELDGSDVGGSEGTEFGDDELQSPGSEGDHCPLEGAIDPPPLPPSPRVTISASCSPEGLVLASRYPQRMSEASLLLLGSTVDLDDHLDSPRCSVARDVPLHPSSSGTDPQSTLSTSIPLPASTEVGESTHSDEEREEVDIDDLRTSEDASGGLSYFLPDLRSLDVSSPPPSSLHRSGESEILEGYEDSSDSETGLSLGFSGSTPDLTDIHTPFTSVIGDDDALVASPSTWHSAPQHIENLPEYFFNPARIVAKPLEYPIPGIGPGDPTTRKPITSRRPQLEVTIPMLPSLLEDEQLTSLMSAVELGKGKSRGWAPSLSSSVSLAPPLSMSFSLSRSSSTGSERSIWPVRSVDSGRRFASPHMKEAPKTKTAGEGMDIALVEGHLEEDLKKQHLPPPRLSPSASPSLSESLLADSIACTNQLRSDILQPSLPEATIMGRMGRLLNTILTPVGSGGDQVPPGAFS